MSALPEIYQRYLRALGVDGVPAGLDGLRARARLTDDVHARRALT